MTTNVTELLKLPDATRCKDCIFRVSRAFINAPIENAPDVNSLDDLEIFINHACVVLETDIMDHIVLDCTKYKKNTKEADAIFTDYFTRKDVH